MGHGLKSLLVRIFRFAMIMLIVALIVGLFYREYSRKFLFRYPMETQVSVGHHLSLAHGQRPKRSCLHNR